MLGVQPGKGVCGDISNWDENPGTVRGRRGKSSLEHTGTHSRRRATSAVDARVVKKAMVGDGGSPLYIKKEVEWVAERCRHDNMEKHWEK